MKYRLPIMRRNPLVTRKPVIQQHAIMDRDYIFDRSAICAGHVNYTGCKLCDKCTNYMACDGSLYNTLDNLDAPIEGVPYLLVCNEKTNWKACNDKIDEIHSANSLVKMITGVPVPRDVIIKMSYSPMNTIQYNVDLFMTVDELNSVKKSIFVADTCGINTYILLYPIMPTVIRTYDVIEFIDSFRAICTHIYLKFLEFDNAQRKDSFYNINGQAVPVKYITYDKTLNRYVCSKEYLEYFQSTINKYIRPHNLSVTICNLGECWM